MHDVSPLVGDHVQTLFRTSGYTDWIIIFYDHASIPHIPENSKQLRQKQQSCFDRLKERSLFYIRTYEQYRTYELRTKIQINTSNLHDWSKIDLNKPCGRDERKTIEFDCSLQFIEMNNKYIRSTIKCFCSVQEHTVDALTLSDDEGRSSLR